MEERSTREVVAETARDVKWICRTLARMEEQGDRTEERLRSLEGWQSETVGEARRDRQIAAGAGGVVGGAVAIVLQMMGWG
ncbi:hypothetical protein [Methanofollis fontis]|uniref:Uncharacterized protein n=1 Tax=Methanofollis fontis TaxID=2052832 RepID=A0A483CRF6_9EURY|nr:hypothetical protein [Methanofollis fontis]TAJ43609.1 hypothetical protein CUJ86_09685 [Methanofollis fontis]